MLSTTAPQAAPDLVWQLWQTSNALRYNLDQEFGYGFSLSLSHFLVMSLLDELPGRHASSLAHLLQVTPQTMSRVLLGLERRCFIKRRLLPAKGCSANVWLTPIGRRMLRRCADIASDQQRTIERALGARGETFGSLLRVCERALREG